MYLHLCLLPGVIHHFKLGTSYQVTSVIRNCLPNIRTVQTDLQLVVEVKDVAWAIHACRQVTAALRVANLVPPCDSLLPFNAVALEEPTVSEALWRVALPGTIVFPARYQVPGALKWLYDLSSMPLVGSSWIRKRLFPLRPLALAGPLPRECFFCGSREHQERDCTDPWGLGHKTYTADLLANTPPSRWREEFARASKDLTDIGDRLVQLVSDLRREFQWHYVELVLRTTATRFKELGTSPLRPIELLDLGELLESIRSGEMKALDEKIRSKEEKEHNSGVLLVKGMRRIMRGELGEALSAFWQAENLAQTPIRKQYASLLQMRAYLLTGNIDGAEAAISRALSTDPHSPQVLYWQGILKALRGNKEGLVNSLKRLEAYPRWLAAGMAEPLTIMFEQEVERRFLASWQKAEQGAKWILEQVDAMLEALDAAFGPGTSDELGLEVRDWRGRLASQGYEFLLSAPEFFKDIQKKTSSITARRYHVLLEVLSQCGNRLRDVVQRMPRKRRRYPLRDSCEELLAYVEKKLHEHKAAKKLHELANLYLEVEEIRKKTSDLVERCEAAINLEWKYALLRRFIILGAGFVAMVWLGFYLYSLVFEFLE